ncbi:type I-C CRISPR-associated protein Cas8c/Csd1 [Parachitinimonas caeni]|uniref:Type I-C CRISPR-associated protein Cas8c/Csd1 n=1 Tax=Parachitinimonas caeni TaxID=3031301 RepID=A0ABT7DZ09_9NEIS|nr:type I-C CRISPR-associated protein Cas8c/Csd1 [Parachitinimonas caeni]MDK2125300.1 type I-C CRISPR-associated protein Cas8c/Csd1 [Parachitinimonas caeni]
MILQALDDYYRRRAAHPDPTRRLAPIGLVDQAIGYLIVIDRSGQLVQLRKTGELRGKKHEPGVFLVPRGKDKTSGIEANLLWQSAEYVLGVDIQGNPERAAAQHQAFRNRLQALEEPAASDAGLRAVLTFLDHLPDRELAKLQAQALWLEIIEAKVKPNLTFELNDDEYHGLICQRPAILQSLAGASDSDDAEQRLCLVRGVPDTIARLHPPIKGVWEAQTSGAKIVSFNLSAFDSYGKGQGDNAPVGNIAAQTYTTALNAMLASGSPNRVQVADASTVFWADNDDPIMTHAFRAVVDDPDRNVSRVAELYAAIHKGSYQGDLGQTRFHVLALAPNAARIAIRDYQCLPLAELAQRIVQHFDDLALTHGSHEPDHLPLFRLLVSLVVQGKADNIPPRLGGDVLRAILTGGVYPMQMIQLAVLRCRAERKITYARAAAIKAWLNRHQRTHNTQEKEFKPMLDLDNTQPGYRLGRLFAALEKVQEEAQPGINATIRDRFCGAASSTPASVFPTLMRLLPHHLAKLNRGRSINLERLISEIVFGLGSRFPAHLTLVDQGSFWLGYYQQRQELFTKHTPSDTENTNQEEN